jgi:ABC-type glutathione transport system ATPase component
MSDSELHKLREMALLAEQRHHITIVVEGVTGSGKTTMARMLERLFKQFGLRTTYADADKGSTLSPAVTLLDLCQSGYWHDVTIRVRNTPVMGVENELRLASE